MGLREAKRDHSILRAAAVICFLEPGEHTDLRVKNRREKQKREKATTAGDATKLTKGKEQKGIHAYSILLLKGP